MSAAAWLLAFLSRWIDDVAAGLLQLDAALRKPGRIELTEQADGSFLAAASRNGALEELDQPPLRFDQDRLTGPLSLRLGELVTGSRVCVVLAPSRFIFRPLELPRAAGPFLQGIVRSQIDRLTPWSASAALFGWSAPAEVGSDRIALTVAAAARQQVDQIAQALVASRAGWVELSTRDEEGKPLILAEASGETGVTRLRLVLIAAAAISSLAFATSFVAWITIGAACDARLSSLQNQIAIRLVALSQNGGTEHEQALRALQSRKQSSPSAVMILEALSNALPDDTHLTELRIEPGKVQMVGLAADASQLIRLIERSPQFTTATFFAPTVRGANGEENFQIAAHTEPSFPVTN